MGCSCRTWTPTPSNCESHKTTREAAMAAFAKSWQRVLINAQIAAPPYGPFTSVVQKIALTASLLKRFFIVSIKIMNVLSVK